jgi:hypothetical protein
MAAKTYRLRIGGDGKEFEAEGDKAFVLSMAKIYGPNATVSSAITTSGKAAKKHEKHVPLAQQPSGKDLSIREVIQQLNLKKQTDIVIAFGYYLEKYRGAADFSAADINNCYYEAKLESSNTSQMIANGIISGRLMPSRIKGEKGRKRYTLTGKGEEFVKSKFPPAN